MNKNRNKISPTLKSQILSESLIPGCVISELAKAYNISKTTIYTWQREEHEIMTDNGNKAYDVNNFIELSINQSKNSILNKASFIFNDFSLTIEGTIRSSSLFEILKILENQSC